MKAAAKALLALGTMIALSSPATAQYTSSYGYTFNNPISASCNTMFWNKMNARMLYRTMLKKKGYTDAQLNPMSTEKMLALLGGDPGAAEARKSAPGAATKFTMAGRYLLVSELAKGLVEDRETQKALQEVFVQGIREYEKQAAPSGFSRDVAGAITFFLGTAYFVYRGGEDPDEKGLDRIGWAIQAAWDTPEFKAISNSDKQKFYELMISLGTYLAVAYQQAVTGGNAVAAEQLKGAAAEILKGYLKLDPKTVRITANGLEIVKP
jgi:hypothetical protein